MNTKKNKSTRVSTDQRLRNGAQKHLGKTSLVIDGRTYAQKEVLAILDGRMEATTEVEAAKAMWQAKVREEQQKLEQTKRFVSGLRQTLLVMFASSEHVLADFGLAPRRAPRELTAVEKLERVARAKSTREARHTMGARAKAKIKGDPDVNVVVTTGAPADASTTPPSPSLPPPAPPAPAPVPPAPAPVPVPPVLPPPATSAPAANGALNGASSL